MKDHAYTLIELTGSSATSIEDAIFRAVQKAYETIKNLCWFQVIETPGQSAKDETGHWQATIRVGSTVEG